MTRAKTRQEYSQREQQRRPIISENLSRRMRKDKLPPLPVPEKLLPPQGYEILDAEGIYYSFTKDRVEAREMVEDIGGTCKLVEALH